jgi:hypothetical protein
MTVVITRHSARPLGQPRRTQTLSAVVQHALERRIR